MIAKTITKFDIIYNDSNNNNNKNTVNCNNFRKTSSGSWEKPRGYTVEVNKYVHLNKGRKVN